MKPLYFLRSEYIASNGSIHCMEAKVYQTLKCAQNAADKIMNHPNVNVCIIKYLPDVTIYERKPNE